MTTSPARARVLAVDDPEVELELLDEPGSTAEPSADPSILVGSSGP